MAQQRESFCTHTRDVLVHALPDSTDHDFGVKPGDVLTFLWNHDKWVLTGDSQMFVYAHQRGTDPLSRLWKLGWTAERVSTEIGQRFDRDSEQSTATVVSVGRETRNSIVLSVLFWPWRVD